MGSIQVHEFMTLDGVIDTPTWSFEFEFLPRMQEVIGHVTSKADGILLGRTTYDMFYPAWSTRTAEDDPGAPFFNDTTKYVVSSTLSEPEWANTEVIGSYDVAALRRLKDRIDGDIYVSGSGTLVKAMLADGLVDGLHLLIYPVTRGDGPRLFDGESPPTEFTLVAGEVFDNGVVYLNYRPKD